MIKIVIISAAVVAIASISACAVMYAHARAADGRLEEMAEKYNFLDQMYKSVLKDLDAQAGTIESIQRDLEYNNTIVERYFKAVERAEEEHGKAIVDAEKICIDNPSWADDPLPDGVCGHIRARTADGNSVQNNSIKSPVDSIDSMHPSKGYASYD